MAMRWQRRVAIEPRWSDVIVCPSPKANHRHLQYYRITTWPRSRSSSPLARTNIVYITYAYTSADSTASNISSDASAEIALIMLIKLVCLLIGPVKVPISLCVLLDYPAIDPLGCRGALNQAWSHRSIQYVVGRSTRFTSSHIVLAIIFDLPLR